MLRPEVGRLSDENARGENRPGDGNRPEEVVRMRDKLEQIAALAGRRRLARLSYRRPGEGAAAHYVVEPYRIQRTGGGPSVHAWQVSPQPDGRADGWRDFRLDRITEVADGGATFVPRMPVELGGAGGVGGAGGAGAGGGTGDAAAGHGSYFHGWGERQIAAMGPAEDYFRQVETSMLDAKVTPEEMELARSLGDRVGPHERKAVHARVYANVLHEVLQDGKIMHREELYLKQVREFLEQLGWAP
jgi:hypothetical protein